MSSPRPIRVAVVGGGCAALTAAFELTRPQHAGRYELTVYQLGWRLGGKGASGRGPADRIEEHGLHVWMGFYENAFRLMRECYEELGRDPEKYRIAHWRDAFEPEPFTGVTERAADGSWQVWRAFLPPSEGLPGDPYSEPPRWTVGDYMVRAAALLRTVFESLEVRSARGGARGPVPRAAEESSSVSDRISRFLRYGELATLTALLEAVRLLDAVVKALPRYPDSLVLRFLDAIGDNAREQIETLVHDDDELRRLWTILDLTLATMRGIVRFGLVSDPRGFDAIDDYDCREWLMLNGASRRSVDSGYLRGLYDLGFSYEDGDFARPRIAAGQALRGMVRAFFTYRGCFFWKMQAGMGDVVFAPLYEVLKRRGVRFEFFHRLENVKIADPETDGDATHVAALEFDVQARTKGGREYRPLVDVRGLPCWPAKPDPRQLLDGERLEREGWEFESFWDTRKVGQKVLEVGRDFDLVVLGVGLGAVPHLCSEIVARDPRWRAMIDHVKTVATQAFQIWLRPDLKDLGWSEPPITVSGFVEPFDTWADMRHLVTEESWRDEPRGLAYFCNVLPDLEPPADRSRADYPQQQQRRVLEGAVRFLNQDVVHLWPKAVRAPGEFRWEVLADPAEAGPPGEDTTAGDERFASQFWVANVNPSDRYVLSLPGSQIYRISPLDATYDNLTIAGDWTACGFNAGCVEAATMSGRLAAHALSGSPRLEDIIGYDHP